MVVEGGENGEEIFRDSAAFDLRYTAQTMIDAEIELGETTGSWSLVDW